MKINIINGLSNSGKTQEMILKYKTLKENHNSVSFLNKKIYSNLFMDLWYSKNPDIKIEYDYLINDETELINILKKNTNYEYLFFDEFYSYSTEVLDFLIEHYKNQNIEIYMSNCYDEQIDIIKNKNVNYNLITLNIKCKNCDNNSIIVCPDNTNNITENYCYKCYCKKVNETAAFIKDKISTYPLLPSNTLYQPFYFKNDKFYYNLSKDFCDNKIIRDDTDKRINIYLKHHKKEFVSYIDLGCNTGYFCDYMSETLKILNVYGIDICKTMIDICIQKSKYLLLNNNYYICKDLYDYFINSDKTYDVISAYSVVQWLMIQKGDEKGVELLEKLAEITNKILIVEIGDYKEHHYDKLKIPIGTEWLIELLKKYFVSYIVYDKEMNNIKRDIIYFFKY
jgi:SAM-dependent methyltransferase